jgi:heptosyltransferase-2/heptosyltransferase-3
VTGSLAESELAIAVASASGGVPAPGEFDLPELAAVVSRAALVVGSDSGPLHLAVARGTPTVHVFGPADPAKFGPWGPPKRHLVLTADVGCRPCGDLSRCQVEEQLACMRGVSVEQVLGACRSLLGL